MFEFLLIISAMAVIQVIYKIIVGRRCIDDRALKRMMMNQLKDRERNQVITHLGICKKCQERMHEIKGGL